MKICTSIWKLSLFFCLTFAFSISKAQNVGIGTTNPLNKLHVESASASPSITGFFKLNSSAGSGQSIGLKSEVTGSAAGGVYGGYLSASNTTSAPLYGLKAEVTSTNGGGGSPRIGVEGIAYSPGTGVNIGVRGWGASNGIGSAIGLYGTATGGDPSWAGLFAEGDVYIQNKLGINNLMPLYPLDANGLQTTVGNFRNLIESQDYTALRGECNNTPYYGYGVRGIGGYTGVFGQATLDGAGSRFGVYGVADNGLTANYGTYGEAQWGQYAMGAAGIASDAANAYGVYGSTSSGSVRYAGYFSGNVYSTGSYLPSDKKLKSGVKELYGGLEIIDRLTPAIYEYRTDEFAQMNLPAGMRYGLIADDVKQVLPNLVTKAVQPAVYEKTGQDKGKLITEAVEFNAINYTELIPVLISAVKEQTAIIKELRKEIELLKKQK